MTGGFASLSAFCHLSSARASGKATTNPCSLSASSSDSLWRSLPPLPSSRAVTGGLSEQDEARQAVQGGAIRPLNEILAGLSPGVARDIVRVKLERRDGRWLYELRHVDSRGRMSEIVVDAATGAPVAETDD